MLVAPALVFVMCVEQDSAFVATHANDEHQNVALVPQFDVIRRVPLRRIVLVGVERDGRAGLKGARKVMLSTHGQIEAFRHEGDVGLQGLSG
ncbi:hypothetical protein BKA62DRAFT_695848 [Auriculariales sp. MPI-PUGE-AT-0066]|nr:hypothetical protein BKA62DRAFT_695848 [Auriculariales sp. MPI-PUGE-AT-0066]